MRLFASLAASLALAALPAAAYADVDVEARAVQFVQAQMEVCGSYEGVTREQCICLVSYSLSSFTDHELHVLLASMPPLQDYRDANGVESLSLEAAASQLGLSEADAAQFADDLMRKVESTYQQADRVQRLCDALLGPQN